MRKLPCHRRPPPPLTDQEPDPVIYLVTWNLNGEDQTYAQARREFIARPGGV